MKIINLGIMAHVDAGKTTVTEGLLYHSGAIKKIGRVDHGTTVTDSMEIEQQRGMTVRSATVSFTWNDCKVNLIDTPGHVDFVAEVERSLSVVDGVVLVISAKEGVQPQTRVIFRKLQELKLPTIIFINKIDRMGAAVQDTLNEIKKQLTDKLLILQRIENEGERECSVVSPDEDNTLKHNVIEQLLTFSDDESLLEDYLYANTLDKGRVTEQYKHSVANCLCYPVLYGAALLDTGIEVLLNAITQSFDILDKHNGDACAYVYKVVRDRHKCIYFRVLKGCIIFKGRYLITSGVVDSTTVDNNDDLSGLDKIGVSTLFALEQGRQNSVGFIEEGDIGVLFDLPRLHCGDYLIPAELDTPVLPVLKKYDFIEPLLKIGIEPELPEERRQLLGALNNLCEEDPLLSLFIHPDTAEISVSLFGKLQIDVLKQLLNEKYNLQVHFTELKTTLREHPTKTASFHLPFCAAPNHLAAGIDVRIEPLETGAGILYESLVSYGYLTKSFQNAAREGAFTAFREGMTGSNELTDAKITLVDAFYDSVTSTPADYRKAMPVAVKQALLLAEVELQEPWQHYELSAPVSFEKQSVYDLTMMRGTLDNISHTKDTFTITGNIPVDTSKSFADGFIKYTEGKGSFQTEFWCYLPMSIITSSNNT